MRVYPSCTAAPHHLWMNAKTGLAFDSGVIWDEFLARDRLDLSVGVITGVLHADWFEVYIFAEEVGIGELFNIHKHAIHLGDVAPDSNLIKTLKAELQISVINRHLHISGEQVVCSM